MSLFPSESTSQRHTFFNKCSQSDSRSNPHSKWKHPFPNQRSQSDSQSNHHSGWKTNDRSRTHSPTIIPDGNIFFFPSSHRSQILGPTTIPDGNIFFPSSDRSRIHGPTTTLIGNILSAFKQPVIKQTCYQKKQSGFHKINNVTS